MRIVARRCKPLPASHKGSVPVPGKDEGVGVPRPANPIDLLMSPLKAMGDKYEFGKRPGPPEYGIDSADPALTWYFGDEGSEDNKTDFVTQGEHALLKKKSW